MHRDSNNLIVQADFDGGDCLSVTSAFYFIKPSPEFAENLKYLERTPGIYIRHPSYPDINDVSRDQLDPLICALGENGLRDKLKMLLSYHAEKFFFYPNNDLPMFSTPGLYIRALGLWYLYPILLILDLGFLFIFFQNLANHNPNDVDDRNCVVRFTQAIKHYPTPWSSSVWSPTHRPTAPG